MASEKMTPRSACFSENHSWRNDWRIMGQEGYLLNKKLQHRHFSRTLCRDDFTQCEFCWSLFDKDVSCPSMAFFEPQGKYWICETCYRDFREHFGWEVEDEDSSVGYFKKE
jgi:hypothetical protein